MIYTIFRDDEVIVAVNGVPYTIGIFDARYETVLDAIAQENEMLLTSLLSAKVQFANISQQLSLAGFTNQGSTFFYKDNALPTDLSLYLADAMKNGNVEPIVKFISSLFENPNYNTRTQLFGFMDRNKMPINKDGHFLAYKVVRADYLDKHTGTMSNAPGTKVNVSWSEVDTDPDKTCSKGLHCCSKDYIGSFYSTGDRIVSVAVDPKNVGSIPNDYNGAKMRTREYVVVADITDEYLADNQHLLHVDNEGIDPHRTYLGSNILRDYF